MEVTEEMYEAVYRAEYACIGDPDRLRVRVLIDTIAPLIAEAQAKEIAELKAALAKMTREKEAVEADREQLEIEFGELKAALAGAVHRVKCRSCAGTAVGFYVEGRMKCQTCSGDGYEYLPITKP